jgi:hypothetical protein
MAQPDAIAAFQQALNSADPVQMLLAAEGGGHGVDPSIAPRAAATAVMGSLGFLLSNYDQSTQQTFVELTLTTLASLRYLTSGPTLQNPRGNYHSWVY